MAAGIELIAHIAGTFSQVFIHRIAVQLGSVSMKAASAMHSIESALASTLALIIDSAGQAYFETFREVQSLVTTLPQLPQSAASNDTLPTCPVGFPPTATPTSQSSASSQLWAFLHGIEFALVCWALGCALPRSGGPRVAGAP